MSDDKDELPSISEMFAEFAAEVDRRAEEPSELQRLRMALIAAHPDHGGTLEALEEARARYHRERRRISANDERRRLRKANKGKRR